MPAIAHNHQFTATASGYACELPYCNVSVTNAEIASNISTTTAGMSNKHIGFNDLLNIASKKSGKS